MSRSAERMRAWRGPAILGHAFRPFFLGAAVWAVLAMALWLHMIAGGAALPTAFDPVTWHAHEFLFGYFGAVSAGFLLTAVPNWTGRLPIIGWPLAGLALLWVLGRIAVAVSAGLPPLFVAIADLAMPVVLAMLVAREIVAGRNWRNLVVLAMLVALTLANAVFHIEAALGFYAAEGFGLRAGLASAVMMIAVIGGRIVPSFTRNWLARQGPGRLPVPPMQLFDKLALLVLLLAAVIWIAAPASLPAGIALILAAVLHLLRLARWAGHRTASEPLVWVLHAGYAFLPAGALALGLAILTASGAGVALQHVWMAGGVGVMTLAVMTRATLGHSGRPLTAGAGSLVLYLALIASVLARLAAGALPEQAGWLLAVSGAGWLGAFGGFVVLYGPLLVRQRRN